VQDRISLYEADDLAHLRVVFLSSGNTRSASRWFGHSGALLAGWFIIWSESKAALKSVND
jgi:hypothetical protein